MKERLMHWQMGATVVAVIAVCSKAEKGLHIAKDVQHIPSSDLSGT